MSKVGNTIFLIALGWHTYDMTHSASATALIEFVAMLPSIVLLLFGGVVADRLSRRLILIFSDVGSGIGILVIAFLAWTQTLQYWHLLLLVAFFGTVSSFFGPAYAAIRPQLLEKEALASANALDGVSRQISRLLGPLFCAALIWKTGYAGVYACDGLTFIFAGVCSLLMHVPNEKTYSIEQEQIQNRESKSERRGFRRLLADVSEGLLYTRQMRWLWVSLIVFSIANIGQAAPLIVAVPKLVASHYHTGEWLLSAYASANAIGSLMAMIYIGQRASLRHRCVLVYITSILSSLCMACMGVFGWPIAFIIASIVMGIFGSIADTLWPVLIQEYVPTEKLGRVSSINMITTALVWPIGYFLVGGFSDIIGPAVVFIIGGIFSAVVRCYGFTVRDIRQLP
jgi:MFS family permease